MRQFQEQQIGQLLQIVTIAHPVIAQGVAKIPDFLDEGRSVHQIPIKYELSTQPINLKRKYQKPTPSETHSIKYPSSKFPGQTAGDDSLLPSRLYTNGFVSGNTAFSIHKNASSPPVRIYKTQHLDKLSS